MLSSNHPFLKIYPSYYPYFVKEGERPDIISNEQYGTIGYAYLIMLVNDIYDPNFDWPLSSQIFEKFIGSINMVVWLVRYLV